MQQEVSDTTEIYQYWDKAITPFTVLTCNPPEVTGYEVGLLSGLPTCVCVRPGLLCCAAVTRVKGITGDVPKRVGVFRGFQDLSTRAGVKVGLEGSKDGDESVDIVDANAHLDEEENV